MRSLSRELINMSSQAPRTYSPAARSPTRKTLYRILGNEMILNMIKKNNLIEPFFQNNVSCNGIDLRLAGDYYSLLRAKKTFDTHKKNLLRLYYHRHKTQNVLIRPDSRLLVSSVERLRMPDNLIGFVGLRSSYARLGLQMPSGFVDPGFVGQLTFEISGGNFPVLLHVGDRVFHATFGILDRSSRTGYRGKYQHQRSVTLPIFPE
jgi:dCTP deaminase